MGTHRPEADQGHTAHTAVLGPRRAAARSRKRRALFITSAAGAALLVGGTATAAVVAGGTDPAQSIQSAAIPPAQTDPLAPGEASAQADEQDGGQDTPTPATASAQGDNVAEEPEPEPREETGSGQDGSGSSGGNDDGGSGGSGEPTGEGGTCEASFYGDGFHGSTTANGETFDTNAMTAAHKTLPFDTMVEVTNPGNGKSVTVRINDRGPYIDGRCLDLSTAAFDEIIGTGSGVGTVDWQVVG